MLNAYRIKITAITRIFGSLSNGVGEEKKN